MKEELALPSQRRILVAHHRLVNSTERNRIQQIAKRVPGVELTHAYSLRDTPQEWRRKTAELGKYDAVLSLGSSDVDRTQPTRILDRHDNRMIPFVADLIESDKLGLAVCLSDHTIVEATHGKVGRDLEKQEAETVKLKLTEAGRQHYLFNGLPNAPRHISEPIRIVAVHKDTVEAPPDNAIVLGSTQKDANSVLQIGKIVLMQPHPELTPEHAEATMFDTNAMLELSTHLDPYPVRENAFTPVDDTELIVVNLFRGPTEELIYQAA